MRTRRLPGFCFEVQPPPPTDLLPRMDVATFVGFAASGPLHRPVRVEDVAQFEAIFGADAPLAWDRARGEPVYAYLAPAVRAFFRNGGRTCWIIRVAGQACSNHFAIPSLMQVQFDQAGHIADVRPAFAQARSEGSWSDAIRVSTSLLSRTLVLNVVSLDPPLFDVTLKSPTDLAPGDLLRVTYEDGAQLLCAVKSIEADTSASPPERNLYHVSGDKAIGFKASWAQQPDAASGMASMFTHNFVCTPIPAKVLFQNDSTPTMIWPTSADDATVTVDLALAYSDAPLPGSLLRLDFGGDPFWLQVSDVRASAGHDASPLDEVRLFDGVRVSGQGLWQSSPFDSPLSSFDLAEQLTFELWTQQGPAITNRLSDLGFDLRQTRCWDALPTDDELYPELNTVPRTDRTDLWAAAASPRFPLAGAEIDRALYIPLGMPIVPDFYLGHDPIPGDALHRDGLNVFNASLFLDAGLADVGARDLLAEADFIRYQSPTPRSLRGLHAALSIDEATLIAVPDAVHRGWFYQSEADPLDPPPSLPLERPEWWHHLDCDPRQAIPVMSKPIHGNFLNCAVFDNLFDPPVLCHDTLDQTGTFTLMWTTPAADVTFVLEESASPKFTGAIVIYAGTADRRVIYGHPPGVYYYRVRATRQGYSSNWSNGIVLNLQPASRWLLTASRDYADDVLLAVQHALLRLAAARGDLLAVLALPEHYREAQAIEHGETLTTKGHGLLGPEDDRTLSFGALYHSWLIGREENRPAEFRRTPPDGAACGLIAQRTLARGAWLAPANEWLKGVVALTPALARNRWLDLQLARINVLRQEPHGFAAMNADTLTGDDDVRPINVRRLLMLLRRLAVRLGATYVFEPHSTAFRRAVQRGFEALLEELFARGAFAGTTTATSFQVITDDTLNTPASVDEGRFIMELRVAPSLPLSFMTIRLVQSGDRSLVTQEL